MRTSILVLCLLAAAISTSAQSNEVETKQKRVIYFNNFLAGGLFGEKGQGSGLTISTTHGIRLNRFAFGGGVGFDSYIDWKTVPVFGSLSFDFAKVKRNAFFIQVNAGYSKADRIQEEEWLFVTREYGGEMIHSLLGYRIVADRFSLYIAAGHKFQRTHFSYNLEPWRSSVPMSILRIEEDMNRVVVQIGIGLH